MPCRSALYPIDDVASDVIEALARATMAVALWIMPRDRHCWMVAMDAEFEEAVDDGRPMRFAAGCLMAVFRDLPTHHSGRFHLARWTMAIGAILPFATFHLGCALSGLRLTLSRRDAFYEGLATGNADQRAMAAAYLTAAPLQTLLLVLLGLFHLLIAWDFVAWNTRRLVIAIAFATLVAGLLTVSIVVVIHAAIGVPIQFGALVLECSILPLLACWDWRAAAVACQPDGGL